MKSIDKAIHSARARLFLQGWISAWGWALMVAAAAAALMITAERAGLIVWPLWAYLGLTATAVSVGPIAGWLRLPDDVATARQLDHRLKLKDTLATALYVSGKQNDPFARRVLAEADQRAARAKVAEAFPIRFTKAWGYAPLAAAAAAMLWLFLPADMLGIIEAQKIEQAEQEQIKAVEAETKEQIVKAVDALAKMEDPKGGKDLDAELGDGLAELAEITKKDLSNPEMKKQAAATLSSVQDRLAQAADQKEQQVRFMQNAMSRLDAGTSGPADQFAASLRRGDFASAYKELEDLAKQVQGMNEQDKQALMQQLGNLAKQLSQAAMAAQQQQSQLQQQMQQAMQNAGLNNQQAQQVQQQLQNGAGSQQIQQTLQQQGMNQQQAQQLAQQLQQMQQQSQQNNQGGQNQNQSQNQPGSNGMQNLSQALQQMSQGVGQCNNPGQQGQQQSQSQQQGRQQLQQGMGQAGQAMSQIAQMQQQLQQMRTGQQQMQQAMQSMGMGSGSGQGNQQQLGMKPPFQNKGSQGTGSGIGDEDGGGPIGQERKMHGYQTEAHGDIGQGQGKIIASWLTPDGPVTGQSNMEFNTAVNQAKGDAEKAVNEDRVPQRYHETIRNYFNQLPQSPEEVRQSSPPPAPR